MDIAGKALRADGRVIAQEPARRLGCFVDLLAESGLKVKVEGW